jgi:tRNA (guanine26-N2/guanine27-N2)-dimethyltransferase
MTQVTEGKAVIELQDKVFYNPRMIMNRDMNVACITALDDVKSYVDAMSASGMRGIRVKLEVPREMDVTINDWDAPAFELMQANAARNNVNVTITNRGANTLLSSTQYDFVDLDPFGTPSPYIDSACRAVKKVAGITATDTAPLCGAHYRAGIRRYGAIPLKTEYHPESGLRLLMGKVVREQAKYDRAFKPLLCMATEHYVRLYMSVEKGVDNADRMLEDVGFIVHCRSCMYREPVRGLLPMLPRVCPSCGGKLIAGGPLWLGPIADKEFVDKVIGVFKAGEFKTKERAIKILDWVKEELEVPVPTHYDQHKLCKPLKATPTDMAILILALRDAGYKASRTHFSGIGFKTDAPIEIIKEIIARLSE